MDFKFARHETYIFNKYRNQLEDGRIMGLTDCLLVDATGATAGATADTTADATADTSADKVFEKLEEAADEGREVSMFELEVDVSQFSSEVAFFITLVVSVSSDDVKIPSSAS